MRVWFLFDGQIEDDKPGSYEIGRFLDVAAQRGYDASVFSTAQFDILSAMNDPENIFIDNISREKPDVVISRTGADTTYLGYAVMRHLVRQGITLLNRATAVENAADKLRSMQILADQGFPVPPTMFGKIPVDIDLIGRKIGFPVVVKMLKGTQGSGVYLSETPEKFRDLTDLLAQQESGNFSVLFQQFVESSHGRDIRAFVVGDRVIAAMERTSTDGNFKANITRGGIGRPITVTPEIERLALGATKALTLDVAGVDLLYANDGYRICEVNSAPDFKGLEKYCHISVPEYIYNLAEIRLKKARSPSANVLSFTGWFNRFRHNPGIQKAG